MLKKISYAILLAFVMQMAVFGISQANAANWSVTIECITWNYDLSFPPNNFVVFGDEIKDQFDYAVQGYTGNSPARALQQGLKEATNLCGPDAVPRLRQP